MSDVASMTEEEVTRLRDQVREIVAYAQLAGEETVSIGLGDGWSAEYWIEEVPELAGSISAIHYETHSLTDLNDVPSEHEHREVDKRAQFVRRLVMQVLEPWKDHPLAVFAEQKHYRFPVDLLPDAYVRRTPPDQIDGRVRCLSVTEWDGYFRVTSNPEDTFFMLTWRKAWQALRDGRIMSTD